MALLGRILKFEDYSRYENNIPISGRTFYLRHMSSRSIPLKILKFHDGDYYMYRKEKERAVIVGLNPEKHKILGTMFVWKNTPRTKVKI
jgi:hypothetical protein